MAYGANIGIGNYDSNTLLLLHGNLNDESTYSRTITNNGVTVSNEIYVCALHGVIDGMTISVAASGRNGTDDYVTCNILVSK